VILVNSTKHTQKKPRIKHRTDRALFSRPGNGAGLFFQSWSPDAAQSPETTWVYVLKGQYSNLVSSKTNSNLQDTLDTFQMLGLTVLQSVLMHRARSTSFFNYLHVSTQQCIIAMMSSLTQSSSSFLARNSRLRSAIRRPHLP